MENIMTETTTYDEVLIRKDKVCKKRSIDSRMVSGPRKSKKNHKHTSRRFKNYDADYDYYDDY